jgi:hypothetical protein
MFNTLSQKGNANQGNTEVLTHPSQIGSHQENKQQMLVRMVLGVVGRTLTHCWWKCKEVQQLWKSVWRFLKELKIELLYDPAIPPLGIYLKECKSAYSSDNLHTHVYCSTIHNN